MVRDSRMTFSLCLLIVLLSSCVANAQVVFSGVGSYAMLDTFAVAAFTQMCSARAGSDCRHWSQSGVNSNDNLNWAQAVDSRNVNIPVEGGTVFIVWDNNTNPISVWSYLAGIASWVSASSSRFRAPLFNSTPTPVACSALAD